MTLWQRSPGRPDQAILARHETDWQGSFSFNEVRASGEAWIEVQALYYLSFRGPSFAIPPGEDLELVPLILHFGGSIHGEVLDGERRGVPDAEVLLGPLDPTDRRAAQTTRTDSKGTFLMSGLEPGGYTSEVRMQGALVASIAGLWTEADAPTLKVIIHLGDNSLTIPQDQDPQQFRVYRSEEIVSGGSTFGSLEEIQGYVDGMIASGWCESGLPQVRAIRVMPGRDSDLARGGVDSLQDPAAGAWQSRVSGHIELLRWGWDELTVLHEVAHVLSPGNGHGQLFARNFHDLVLKMLGSASAWELSLAYAAEGVQW